MNSIIRKLEIYELSGFASSSTIKLNNWIINMFTDLTIAKQEDGTLLYLKGTHQLILQNLKHKKLYVSYTKIWDIFETKYSLDYEQIQETIKYLMFKYYKLKNYVPYEKHNTIVKVCLSNIINT